MFMDNDLTLTNIRLQDFDPEKAFEFGIDKAEAHSAMNNRNRSADGPAKALLDSVGDIAARRDINIIADLCKNKFVKIKHIITLAFNFRISYDEFKQLAEACGYECAAYFPPYFLLHESFDYRCQSSSRKGKYDYEAYKNKLLDTEEINNFININWIDILSFDKAFMQIFYDRYDAKKKTAPLDVLKRNKDFQIQSIRYFFETYFT